MEVELNRDILQAVALSGNIQSTTGQLVSEVKREHGGRYVLHGISDS